MIVGVGFRDGNSTRDYAPQPTQSTLTAEVGWVEVLIPCLPFSVTMKERPTDQSREGGRRRAPCPEMADGGAFSYAGSSYSLGAFLGPVRSLLVHLQTHNPQQPHRKQDGPPDHLAMGLWGNGFLSSPVQAPHRVPEPLGDHRPSPQGPTSRAMEDLRQIPSWIGHADLTVDLDLRDYVGNQEAQPPAWEELLSGLCPPGGSGAGLIETPWSPVPGTAVSKGCPHLTLGQLPLNQPRGQLEEAQEPRAETVQTPHGPGVSLTAPSPLGPLGHSRAASCQPRTHLFFLKVHKSASSTVANILFRFGEKHHLTFALPANRAPHFSYPRHFSARDVEGFSGSLGPRFDILCQHLRFEPTEVQRVMPSDTFYFTILRDPARLLESAFSYYKAMSPFSRARSVGHFLDHTRTFYNPLLPDSHYGRNLMAFDLGFDHNARPTRRRMARMVQEVAARFHLVLIAEHWEESLVLLRDALCWELDDVVAFPVNRRAAYARQPLDPGTESKARAWNALDWALYQHFNRTLWTQLRALGAERLQREVAALWRRREQLAHICLPHGEGAMPGAVRDPQLAPLDHGLAPILGYELKPGLDPATEHTCRGLATPELQFGQRLYLQQFPEKARWLSRTQRECPQSSLKPPAGQMHHCADPGQDGDVNLV
ncbi:PREDICTED: galactose-3-O-sulfotransferase 2-like [Chrysochloris asiatica]|uniref:Galactose-3-O-sulfotransferase 2-like n=1 Tax=Chrysochloris asiatica TaxID=185453 RepID=A0A9B0U9R3_CHRAS|nr:PREDICTED: galactose-3-O-sulfotransferase 2-like [Chrysochloris asiatica]